MNQKLAINGGTPVRTKDYPAWPIADETESASLQRVLSSGNWSSKGPEESRFERRFAQYCGVESVACVSNGTVALELALRALNVGPGDEVLVPAMTWTATAWAVVQVGARPVFVDIDPVDWCISLESMKRARTSSTKAVIPVHLYDQLADMDSLLAFAEEFGLFVIEDCAHAHGAKWKNQGIGTLGDVGTFSFQAHKTLTCGEGGAVITNDSDLADRIYALKDCGRSRNGDQNYGYGGNYRIGEFQAAVLNAQLDRVNAQSQLKRENLSYLRSQLGRVDGISLSEPKVEATGFHCYMASMSYDDRAFAGLHRDQFLEMLTAEGIPAHLPYDPVYQSPLWTSGSSFLALEKPDVELDLKACCPVAESVFLRSGLILHHSVFLGSTSDMDDIVKAIKKIQCLVGPTQASAQNLRSKLAKGLGKLFGRGL